MPTTFADFLLITNCAACQTLTHISITEYTDNVPDQVFKRCATRVFIIQDVTLTMPFLLKYLG